MAEDVLFSEVYLRIHIYSFIQITWLETEFHDIFAMAEDVLFSEVYLRIHIYSFIQITW